MCKNLFGKGGKLMESKKVRVARIEDDTSVIFSYLCDDCCGWGFVDEAVSCDNCKGYGWLDHTSLDRSQWMNDITTILKLGEK